MTLGSFDTIQLADFARRFSQRGPGLMWLLGAGASASSGVPTGGDIVLDLKRKLYISQRKVSHESVADLTHPAVREQILRAFDASHPPGLTGSDDEYATVFEETFPIEADRRAYIDARLSGAKPSYGHLALAGLMQADLARIVWTTNFDALVADACAKVFGTTGRLTTVQLDNADQADSAIQSERWPIELKLHGDFRSRRLKNTNDELRQQDAGLRKQLVRLSQRFGLVVVGYSGRDESVMSTLEEALQGDTPFPRGLFWLQHGDSSSPRIVKLLSAAASRGVEAAIVAIDNFDELLKDLVRICPQANSKVIAEYQDSRKRRTPAPLLSGRTGYPVVRLNGIPVVQYPTVCRKIVCETGPDKVVQEMISVAGADLIATRTREGVLAFGSDQEVQRAFGHLPGMTLDVLPLEIRRLTYDSKHRYLLRKTLSRAIASACGLSVVRAGRADLLAPTNPSDAAWNQLRKLAGGVSGFINGNQELEWREGVALRLEWAKEQLWLLIDPRIVFVGISEDTKAAAADFARERTARRYNAQINRLLGFWCTRIAQNGSELVAMPGLTTGVNASFRLKATPAFSKRVMV